MSRDPSPTAALAGHLAVLLSAVDLSARIAGLERTPDAGLSAILRLGVRALDAQRASVFLVSGARPEDGEAPSVLRVARVGTATVEPTAPFVPGACRPVFTCLGGEGPLFELDARPDDPFFYAHEGIEPEFWPSIAWIPVFVRGAPRAALQLARDRAWTELGPERAQGLRDLADAVRDALSRRGAGVFVDAVMGLLPEIAAPEELARRVEGALDEASLLPDERRAASLAMTLAELARESPEALEFASTVLAAARRAFARPKGSAT